MQLFATPSDRVQVLYIAGAGRSGGTLLGKMLGEHPAMLYVGELRETWTPILTTERLCGCGKRVIECDFWQQVFEHAYGRLENLDLVWMNKMRLKHTRTRHAIFAQNTPERERFASYVERLYHALAEVSGRRVVVDTSRVPGYAHLLDTLPSLDVYVVHLIRDPRAVMYSWQRTLDVQLASRTVKGRTKPALFSLLEWAAQNLIVEALWGHDPRRYYRLRYEDLVQSPQQVLSELLQWASIEPNVLPFVVDGWVEFSPTHSIAGNRYRMAQGRVALSLDDEWQRTPRSASQRIAAWFVHPLSRRYGYLS